MKHFCKVADVYKLCYMLLHVFADIFIPYYVKIEHFGTGKFQKNDFGQKLLDTFLKKDLLAILNKNVDRAILHHIL